MARAEVRSCHDLLVWQKAVALATAVYEATKRFPPGERFGLTAQLRRAAVSVASNIAEGHESGESGEGTPVVKTTYTEEYIKSLFPNSTTGDAGPPGLRHMGPKDPQGNRTWPVLEPGPREWKWSQFEGARRK